VDEEKIEMVAALSTRIAVDEAVEFIGARLLTAVLIHDERSTPQTVNYIVTHVLGDDRNEPVGNFGGAPLLHVYEAAVAGLVRRGLLRRDAENRLAVVRHSNAWLPFIRVLATEIIARATAEETGFVAQKLADAAYWAVAPDADARAWSPLGVA